MTRSRANVFAALAVDDHVVEPGFAFTIKAAVR
jgi:hypothetical protein